MICRFHGGGSYTDTDTRPCPYCEVNEMRPVYDAAIGFLEARLKREEAIAAHEKDTSDLIEADYTAEEWLLDCCRRAKEGR